MGDFKGLEKKQKQPDRRVSVVDSNSNSNIVIGNSNSNINSN